ncbi:MAG: bifunctional oligoribonuclease/PAP phosphatase NrnA [Coriobacteriales bacterium]|nr:bifunctional oligoribonuclease/PAP phosphatase NrnA [Coriobacteriales bacterium]
MTEKTGRVVGGAVLSHVDECADAFERVAALIDAAKTIAICSHVNPDGDALGSGLALAQVIRAHWEGKRVTNLLAEDDVVPRIYRFLPGADDFVRACAYDESPDLFISVDLNMPSRLGDGEAVLARATHTAILDHHPGDEVVADALIVRPEAAAAGVIVTEFAEWLGVEVTKDMAQNLFCAITTDTGRFQYQNADAEAFEVASFLVDHGASPSEVSLNVYQSFRLAFLHLKSAVMGRITTFERGRIAYSYATQADLMRTGASLDESDGLVDVVRSVEGSEVALFLKEVPGGKVRGNLRSKTGRDISGVARALGGGGHRAASGFTIEGTVDDALSAALPLLQALFAEPDSERCDAS